jgi:hypothetical protein
VLERAARKADGWMAPSEYPHEKPVEGVIAEIRQILEKSERDPNDFGIEVRIDLNSVTMAGAVDTAGLLRQLGVSHVCITTLRTAAANLGEHLELLRGFIAEYVAHTK